MHIFSTTHHARRILPAMVAVLLMITGSSAQEVTGLSGWSIYLDPGHSQKENEGLYNYSEAEKVLRVGLILKEMLETQTDIDKVFISRTNDQQQVSLSERTNDANATGADFYYSIHSDAGSPSVNSTLMLYGGWRKDGQTIEKTPEGGKLFGDIMDGVLTEAMRIGRRGNYADRTFYQGFPENHTNQWPYLHVNRTTNMASLLSEAGFHTNPTQQKRNLNAEWRRLEAQAAFWTILEFHNKERPDVGIVTGIITDSQSGNTLNDVTVTICDQTYTTDTYESLFHKYSNNPDELSNGFYYIEDLEPGSTMDVTFSSPNHYDTTVTVTIETKNFTFLDIALESSEAPRIVDVNSYTPVDALIPGDELEITFSRFPDQESLEQAISFDPESAFEVSWKNNYTVIITTDSLEFESQYLLTIRDSAVDAVNGNQLDGDGDGQPGGDFVLEITTSEPDIDPPVLVYAYPSEEEPAGELRPVIRLVYDEPVDVGSLSRDAVILSGDEGTVRGTIQLQTVGRQSVIHFFPETDLQHDSHYTIQIQDDLADRFGNKTTQQTISFKTIACDVEEVKVIDNFNSGISGWWVPQQSGSTNGIITEETGRTHEETIVNIASGSNGSMQLRYGWDPDADLHLIRQYLPPQASQNLRFTDRYVLQAYVFGDGSGNRFRFMLRDSDTSSGPAGQLEGSPWFDIDWIGWKLLSWDLSNDPVVGWVNGNGVLTGDLHTDSFQLGKGQNSAGVGAIYIDDYQVVKYAEKLPTSTGDPLAELPESYELKQNYPNPFNPVTIISYQLPVNSEVTLEVYDMLGRRVSVLVDDMVEAGTHDVSWDALSVSSGVYIYRLQAGSHIMTRKMTLIK